MKFRFTPVVLLFFLSAVLGVSGFLLSTSYKNAQDALHFEQLDQISRTHELAQQFLNFRLTEARRTLETHASFREDEFGNLLSHNALKKTLFDFVIRYEKSYNEDAKIVEEYGDIVVDARNILMKNDRWFIEKTSNGLALSYQLEITYDKSINQQGTRIFKGGFYLTDNFPLINAVRTASRAFAHILVYDNEKLVSSVSLEDGVEDVAQASFKEFGPIFSTLDSPFSGDIKPIRIEKGNRGLFLLSVTTTQGAENWKETFKQTIVIGFVFVVILTLLVTFVLRVLVHRSLKGLLEYAQGVCDGDEDIHYQAGSIIEFNEVGRVIETMVDDMSEKGKYISDMVEAANSPILAWDKDGNITIINKAIQTLFDIDNLDDFKNITDFFDRFNDPMGKLACEEALRGKATRSLETKFNLYGSTRYVIWSVTPLRDMHNAVTGVIAQGQDVTQRRHAEGSLRLSSTVFENTAEGIMITDEKGNIIDVNTAFTDITGYSREDVMGQNPRIMKSGRHSQEFYEAMWGDLHNKGIWRGEIWDKRKSGEEYPKWVSISACKNDSGRLTHYVAVFSDITDKKEDEHKLEQLAHFDHLTGLPNRVLFQDRLQTALARSRRDKEHMAILFVDLDRFKQINDSLGHRVGDLLLVEVSKRLLYSIREIDTVARLSGDEFTVILTDIASVDAVELIASRIVQSLGAPYFFEGHELFVSASVGISLYPMDGETTTDLLRNADVAMYHAKEKGRNNYQFFDVRMNEHAQSQLSMANKLRIALNRNVIHPHYQLKVDIRTGKPIGLEALARWNDENGKPVSPAKFIPIAEEHGLIARVGSSILQQVCVQIRMWQDMNFEFGSVAFNLSAQQFRDPNLLSDIREAIEDNKIDPKHLEVEVTENTMMDDVEDAIQILSNLKDMGLKISIDDFGTGYSSLSYLKRFPVDTLKIDRSFINELTLDSDDAAIVSAIVSMAQKLGVSIVAEGVENIEQSQYLKEIGCYHVQGYLYAKPCAGGELPLVWEHVIREFAE
ncbi:putative Diguanylate cyclase [Candidatus Terasakiella magnetica]|uniref:Putative Diguanylate cyclase n=1 Tax=Candidatus Terasakiella magnetica TaxID=1867952 RepID=A0A1C3RCB3_9PROT|nr:bifunctional diguanylate cyclase/phosphodiesterase [Candidatus Terasakiella magnetica]SCA54888.1 putative Diguanylate cyclase [Candidatus Terasakiella magnetica]